MRYLVYACKFLIALNLLAFDSYVLATPSDPVMILYSHSIEKCQLGSCWQNIAMSFLHKDSGESDSVAVIFENPGFRETTVLAQYKGSTFDGYSRWFVQTSLSNSNHRYKIVALERDGGISSQVELPEFYLERSVGFKLNDGLNIVNCLQSDHYWNQLVRFTAAVRNLSYYKTVMVHYSLDNWFTENRVALHFQEFYECNIGTIHSPNENNVEIWSRLVELPAGTNHLEYYLSYESDGVIYNDRNFGNYYKLSSAELNGH